MLKKWSKFNENNNEFDLSNFIDDIRDNFIDLEDKELLKQYILVFNDYSSTTFVTNSKDNYNKWKTDSVNKYNKISIKPNPYMSLIFKLSTLSPKILDEKGTLQLGDIINNYVSRIVKIYTISIDLTYHDYIGIYINLPNK